MTGIFHPGLLFLIPLVPLLMGAAVWLYIRRRRRVAEALGDRSLVRRLTGADLHTPPRLRVVLLMLAALALGIAAADPRWGEAEQLTETRTLDLVLVLDVSNSMLVEDVPGNRLEQQRSAAQRIVRELQDDQVGLVVFAGRAYVLAPPTRDRGAIELYLDAAGPDIAVQTGSSLAAGLRQATNLLDRDEVGRGARVVVLMSDGEALEEREHVLAAAQQAARQGVTIHTVGIGTPAGGPVPDVDFRTGEQLGFKTDPETGETAISRLDQALLQAIARAANGSHTLLGAAGAEDRLLAQLRAEQRGPRTGTRRTEGIPRFGWFVALALLFLCIDAAHERRIRNPE